MSSASATTLYDLAIIGGGINGCGIARDAAGRGLKVVLIEQGDLAQGTSSASTKLIHGGLRYLEHYEFRLVREALSEREILLKNAPHIIWPLRFVLPHHDGLRPQWLLRLGLLLYDHLGGRKLLPATKTLDLTHHALGEPLKTTFKKGYEYSDCWVDDARLVVLNALDAQERGALILTQTTCTSAQRIEQHWQLQLKPTGQQQPYTLRAKTLRAKILVNAAGPWVEHFLQNLGTDAMPAQVRLVRGSHIVVPKLYSHDRAYIFQNKDGRIIFAIPYEQHFTLLGTTDRDYTAAMHPKVSIEVDEVEYICQAASEYFKQPIHPQQVVWSYSGVRSLYNDGASAAQEATRDYVLKVTDKAGHTPLLSIFGGKITTYRRLAEDALHKLKPYLPIHHGAWTAHAPLAGGDFKVQDVAQLIARLQADYGFLDTTWATRLIRQYGTRAWQVLGHAQHLNDLGTHWGGSLTQQEVTFLQTHEWATQADDILWRRTKLGLHMTAIEREHFTQAWQGHKGHTHPLT